MESHSIDRLAWYLVWSCCFSDVNQSRVVTGIYLTLLHFSLDIIEPYIIKKQKTKKKSYIIFEGGRNTAL